MHSRLKDGSLSLTGWYFDFENGDLLAYNPESSQFEPLALVGSPGKSYGTPSVKKYFRSESNPEDAIPEIDADALLDPELPILSINDQLLAIRN